jgi:glyoxylase-like metal-dependent hydrolase (beta-lactamase superfamily II)
MIRERVADNVYVFTSELYAKVNAGAVVGPDWTVVIDTLAYPEESKEIQEFLEGRLGSKVRYIINTHYHADHSLGNCWFPNAIIVGHALCRQLMDTRGREALQAAQQQNKDLLDLKIVLADVIFDKGSINLRVGKRTLQLIHLPGHSIDNVGIFLVEDRVLFSGDVMMPLPYIVEGDPDVLVESMKKIAKMNLENLIQGHGDVILRGEIQGAVKDNISYIATVNRHVKKASRRRDPEGYLKSIGVESCGKSRILLNGLAEELHTRNLLGMYQRLYGEE